jgi:hypothetical protein
MLLSFAVGFSLTGILSAAKSTMTLVGPGRGRSRRKSIAGGISPLNSLRAEQRRPSQARYTEMEPCGPLLRGASSGCSIMADDIHLASAHRSSFSGVALAGCPEELRQAANDLSCRPRAALLIGADGPEVTVELT